jgi:hypothetical protein
VPSLPFNFLPITPMTRLPIRINRHGEYAPLVNRLTSKHRSYKIAVRTAKRREEKTGIPMGVVTWHDANYVVMPAADAKRYDDEELLVEYVESGAQKNHCTDTTEERKIP